jgi:hypothetical protein
MQFIKNFIVGLIIVGMIFVPLLSVLAATTNQKSGNAINHLQALLMQIIEKIREQLMILSDLLSSSSSSPEAITSSTQAIISSTMQLVTSTVMQSLPTTTSLSTSTVHHSSVIHRHPTLHETSTTVNLINNNSPANNNLPPVNVATDTTPAIISTTSNVISTPNSLSVNVSTSTNNYSTNNNLPVNNSSTNNFVPTTTSTGQINNQTYIMPTNNDPFAIFKIFPFQPSQVGYGYGSFTSPIDPSLLTRDNLVAFFNVTNYLVWKNRETGEIVPIHMSVDPNDMYSQYQGTRPLNTYWDLLYNPIYNKTNPNFHVSLDDPSPTARQIAQHLQDWLTEYPSAFTDPH